MAQQKVKKIYICSECGFETAKWLGKCPDCGSWNSLNEEIRAEIPKKSTAASVVSSVAAAEVSKLNDVESGDDIRYLTGIDELDPAYDRTGAGCGAGHGAAGAAVSGPTGAGADAGGGGDAADLPDAAPSGSRGRGGVPLRADAAPVSRRRAGADLPV